MAKELSMTPRNIKRREQTRLRRIDQITFVMVDIDYPDGLPYPDESMDKSMNAFIDALEAVHNEHIRAVKFMTRNNGQVICDID